MKKHFKKVKRLLALLLVLSFIGQQLYSGGYLVTNASENAPEDITSTEMTTTVDDTATTADASESSTVENPPADSSTVNTKEEPTTTENTQATTEIVKIEVDTSKAPTSFTYKAAFTTDGLLVAAVYADGSKKTITDYSVEYSGLGLDKVTSSMGKKVITVSYKEKEKTYTAEYTVKVVPAEVQNVIQYNATSKSFSLSWDKVEDATGYQVVAFNEAEQKWNIYVKGGPTENKVPENNVTVSSGNQKINVAPGSEYDVRIRSFYKCSNGDVVYSELSPIVKVVTLPESPAQVAHSDSTKDSISINWSAVSGADGYEVYRKLSGDSDYIFCNTTTDTTFTDNGLTAGKTYYYKVRAYNSSRDYCGAYSPVLKTSTLPETTSLKSKGGAKRLRVSWSKVTGATGYKIYVKKKGEDDYKEVATVSSSTLSYVKTGLVNGTEYLVQVRAYRLIDNVVYLAPETSPAKVTPVKVSATSKKAKYYKTKKAFKNSTAYKKVAWFKKYVNYSKSFVMPGVTNTNVGGFNSYNMCPQAITFAGKYLLMTAYDRTAEENSVIYVMSKSTRKLVTTIVLPDQYHVGGITYDGSNVWICHGNSVAAIKYSTISSAAAKKKAYVNVDYRTIIKVQSAASYMTYYKGLLFVGVCYERGNQPLYSYTIGSKTGTPTLKVKDKKMLPSRVQGIAFLSDGSLVLSRSNLYIKGSPYYIARLEYYKPTWSGKKITALGKCKNVCQMPTMNEGIAINGKYLYVTYESPAFSSATIPMDRICAFSLSAVKSKK